MQEWYTTLEMMVSTKTRSQIKANLTGLLASMVLPDFSLIIVDSVLRIQEEWICLYVQYFCYGPKACLTSPKKL